MRTIVSQHPDEASLRAVLFHDTPSSARPFELITFPCAGDTSPGESMRLVVCAESQRVSLNVSLVARRQLGPDQWEYLARVDEADRVWLEMMLTKLRTIRRFTAMPLAS
jgi:hypothetical protein